MKRAVALAVLLLLTGSARASERYDSRKAGHPVRVIAYAVHPVGWLLDRLIFYPAWWIGGHEPLRSIFGHAGLPERDVELVYTPPSPAPAE